ncbi:MAG: universal stress protein [Geodermatophilaceae bacterium]|nr:universal stress protein [Geodermatophilaceae bacterium]
MARSEDISFDPPISGGIVAGHDGSAAAHEAMRWAVQQGRLGGQVVHVVRAWVLSGVIRDMGGGLSAGVPSFDEAGAWVEDQLHRALATCEPEGVQVHTHVIHEASTDVILTAAATADLVVLGNRGRGGFAGAIIGSVAENVVRHAPCTVVVVRKKI